MDCTHFRYTTLRAWLQTGGRQGIRTVIIIYDGQTGWGTMNLCTIPHNLYASLNACWDTTHCRSISNSQQASRCTAMACSKPGACQDCQRCDDQPMIMLVIMSCKLHARWYKNSAATHPTIPWPREQEDSGGRHSWATNMSGRAML